MQIGTRWHVGQAPPSRVPAAYLPIINEVEVGLRSRVTDAESYTWTLSWLEGRAIIECDDGAIVQSTHDGTIELSYDD